MKPIKPLDKTSKIGKGAFKIAFGANIVSFLVMILAALKVFSLYSNIVFAVSLAIAFFAYAVLLIDIIKFNLLIKNPLS